MDSTRRMLDNINKKDATTNDNSTSSSKSNKETPLEKHIRYFGGDQPEGVSYTSIFNQNRRLGNGWFASIKNATIVITAAGTKIHGCPCSMFKPREAIGVLNHPMSTGIFDLDGSINEEKWDELLQYAEENDAGNLIIREASFYKFLESCRKLETRLDPFGVALATSNGEWRAFFDKFATSKDGTRFVPIERLREFYENSATVGMQVETRVTNRL